MQNMSDWFLKLQTTGLNNKMEYNEEKDLLNDLATLRVETTSEEIKNFKAHSGECQYCGGIVKMARDQKTFKLVLDGCWCLRCGQRYYVKTDLSVDDFDKLMWGEKTQQEKENK